MHPQDWMLSAAEDFVNTSSESIKYQFCFILWRFFAVILVRKKGVTFFKLPTWFYISSANKMFFVLLQIWIILVSPSWLHVHGAGRFLAGFFSPRTCGMDAAWCSGRPRRPLPPSANRSFCQQATPPSLTGVVMEHGQKHGGPLGGRVSLFWEGEEDNPCWEKMSHGGIFVFTPYSTSIFNIWQFGDFVDWTIV